MILSHKFANMLTNMKKRVLILLFIFIFAGHSFAEELLFKLIDPVGDDYGPGSYVYPKNPVFKAGSFDLTAFEIYENENDIIFKIYFKNWFKNPPALQISPTKNLEDLFRTNLFLQNIDIYIDKDHKLNSGITDAIPGRNVKITPESAWEQAIFISPQPFLARTEMKRLAEKNKDKVIVPADYEVSKNFVRFKIAKKILGQPSERWGYLVLITGAEWEISMFSLSNWMNYGSSYEEPVLNRIVEEHRSEWQFGGGDKGGSSPNIIDMLVATEESQEKILSAYDPKTRKRAVLSAVYPFSSPLEVEETETKEAFAVEAEVIDVLKNVVTIDIGRESGIHAGRLGQIFDANDALAATIIVEVAKENIAICTIVPLTQRAEVAAGMKARFK